MKKILFLGQAPARPGSKHEIAGTYLEKWLRRLDIGPTGQRKDCRFYALLEYFPGNTSVGHMAPTEAQVQQALPRLRKAIGQFDPDLVIPVGKLAINALIPSAAVKKLDQTIGNRYELNPLNSLPHAVPIIPLPHPSGRSSWIHSHADLLDQALELIRTDMGN